MKSSLLFWLIIWITPTFQDNTPKRAETIDWINSKSKDSYVYDAVLWKEWRELKIKQDGSFEIKQYSTPISKFGLLGSPPTDSTFFYGNLKDLNPTSVKVDYEKNNPNLFFVYATCTNSKDCIKQIGSEVFNTSKVAFGAYNKNSDKDIENRMVKAYKHLIALSGGKKETF